MRIKYSDRVFRLPLLAVLAGFVSSVGAVEFVGLAGSWSLNALETPTRLRETFYNTETENTRDGVNALAFAGRDEIVVNVYFPHPFLVETSLFNFAADGQLSGSEMGTVTQISGNRLTYQNNEGAFTLYANLSGDILKQSASDANAQGLVVALKRPASLATAELEGAWKLATFTTPNGITVTKSEGRVMDTFFAGGFGSNNGSIAIDASGGITGNLTGTAVVTGPGAVAVNIGGPVISFAINASKNTLIGTLQGGNEVEYLMLVREPGSLATSELAGGWRFTALEVPTMFRETYFNEETKATRQAGISQSAWDGEQWVDISHPGAFALNRLSLQVAESGAFSEFGEGSLTATVANGVNLFINGDTIPLHCNADKTLLTGVIDDGDAQTLLVGVRVTGKAAATFDQSVDLKMTPAASGNPLVLSWNGASDRFLQTLNQEGGWENMNLPDGTDSLTVDPAESGGTRLFRVAQTEPAGE